MSDVENKQTEELKQRQAPPQGNPLGCGTCLTFVFFIVVIVEIFLAGFQYRVVDMRWSKVGPFRVMGVLELTQVVFAFVVALIGVISFKANPKLIPIVNEYNFYNIYSFQF